MTDRTLCFSAEENKKTTKEIVDTISKKYFSKIIVFCFKDAREGGLIIMAYMQPRTNRRLSSIWRGAPHDSSKPLQ